MATKKEKVKTMADDLGSIEESETYETNPITDQAEIVLLAAENLLVELEIFAEKLRMSSESITRVVGAKQTVISLKKSLLDYLK